MDKVIAVDGPSGVGKSSVSRALATRLGWTYLDTGAMYRAITLAWLRNKTTEQRFRDKDWVQGIRLDFCKTRILLNGEDVAGPIRSSRVTANVSLVAAEPLVRDHLTRMQRTIGMEKPCILDGRDIGTVVFPNAFFKAFLIADDEIRARRRWLQIGGPDSGRSLEKVLEDQRLRDQKDSARKVAPLKEAEDAFVLDTSAYSEGEVVDKLEREARIRLEKMGWSV